MCDSLSNQGRVPFWRSWGAFMLSVILFFLILYGLRWFLEGLFQENHMETIIGIVVLTFVLAVYGKLWSSWRKWRRKAKTHFNSTSQDWLRAIKTLSVNEKEVVL